MVDSPSATECASCHTARPSRDWPEIRTMFQKAVCTQCYSLLENYTVRQCPECRTVRPKRGWVLLPYTVAGHYRLLSQVSRDATSSVFAGLELNDARAVLIRLGKKVSGGGSSQVLTLFQREKDISRTALQEGLDVCTRVTEIDDTGGLSISIQDNKGLRSLRSIFRSRGSFETDYACNIGAYIAGILHRIHQKGLVHGNLTLDHIMVDAKDPTGTRAGLVGMEYACYKGDCPVILPPESFYTAPEARVPGGLTPASDCYSLAAIIWELVTGKPLTPQDIEQKPDIMPTVLFVELRQMLRKDARSRVSDAGEMADSMRAVSGLIWEFEAVGSECGNAVKTLLSIDKKIHDEPWCRKALKNEGYGIPRIDRLKKDLDHICEQVGELNGDPKVFRDRMSRVSKHIRAIESVVRETEERVAVTGNGKWIIAGLVGIILLVVAGLFIVRPYWIRTKKQKVFSSLQHRCQSMESDLKKTEDLLSHHQLPECTARPQQNGFANESMVGSAIARARIDLMGICREVKQNTTRPAILKKHLDSLRPKLNRLTHACIVKMPGKTTKKQ